MTSRGTRKFEYTDGLDKTSREASAHPGICGTPISGFAVLLVVAMVAIAGAALVGFMALPPQ